MHSSFNGDGTIEDRILQARDTVYEDELFHELVREARAIASFGVTTRQNLIQIPASDNLEILLDLVDTDENTSEPEHGISQQGTSIAEGLAHTIRILLAYAHRQNLRRRTQLPLPLTPKTRPVPEHQLIRPALAYIKHMSQVRWLQSLLEDLFGVLQSAGVKPPAYTARIFSTGMQSHSSPTPAVENLVGQFLTPLLSTFNGKILTPRGSFSIAIHTNLSSPPFGTTFEMSFNMPKYPDLESPGKLSHREEVEAAITHLLLLDVVFTISSNSSLKPECDNDPAKRTWEAIYPQHGELLIPTPKPNSEKRMKLKIVLSRHELSLEIYTVRCIDGTGRGNWEMPSYHSMPHTWKPSPIAGPPKPPSLMDFVSKVSRS
jgi:mediator of RNA polymerase II transcription subunit 17